MMKDNLKSRLKQSHVFHPILEFVIGGGITFISALFCMWLCQFSCGVSLTEINAKSAFVLYILIYAIIFALVTIISGRFVFGNSIAMIFLFLITMIDYQVYYFRGTEILPGDVKSFRTALGVAEQYHPQITVNLVIGFVLLLLYLIILQKLVKFRKGFFWRGTSFGVLLASVVIFWQFIDNVPLIAYDNEGMKQNSFPVNFCRLVYGSNVKEPEGYSSEIIKELEDTYCMESDIQNRPVIIAIMNEAFSDLNIVGDLPVDEEILPFFNSMQENTLKGWTQVPVFGAGTANTEWEFLTGHSMHFLPAGATPYSNNALTDSYASIVLNLKKIGYHCIAMHPYYEYGYTRNAVYPRMGFDKMMFLQDFPQKKLLREYVSDQEMYEEIIQQYECHTDNTPLFIFGVTMQNHGGYEYEGDNYTKTVELQNMSQEYPKAEQYLSLLKESDAALEYLIEYFQEVEEDVVIAFFGDHQPAIEQDFYEEIADAKTSEQLQMAMHTVPFFVWANYDIEEQAVECTSVNYLTNYIYDVAQIPKPRYNRFLEQLQENIPVLSTNKVYSQSENKYIEYTELSGNEAKLMQQYNYLVYNAVYDVDGRSEMFKGVE
ncbi:MAG: LTA synthase family protein [Eubacterium sp.]|nr:LTA synthase family protein [Eubacterium sp.]